jgi:hypothetical protein
MIVGTTEAESWRSGLPSRQTFQEALQFSEAIPFFLRDCVNNTRRRLTHKRHSQPLWT